LVSGLSWSRLKPPNRSERRHPGELVHVEIKKLGRISILGAGHRALGHRGSQYRRRVEGRLTGLTGFEYLHVMIDDRTRLASAEVLDDLTAVCAIAFLHRAVAWFAERGLRVAVMSDNGSCSIAYAYAAALRQPGLKHLRIRPRAPASTAVPKNAPRHRPSTSTVTTTDDHTAASATSRRQRD